MAGTAAITRSNCKSVLSFSFNGISGNVSALTAPCQPKRGLLKGIRPVRVIKAQTIGAIRSLVSLKPPTDKVVETEGSVNKKILVSAAAVCFLTHVLTLQGMLLTAYLAAATAVPVGAVNHAIKKRNAWPALCILLPLLLIPHVGILKSMYTSIVNPVSVQIKARITLPALVHGLVGCKHPALRASLKSAQIASQIILLLLLLQYLFAPKIAEAMRQRAIMLCRAFTTTQSQGLKHTERGEELETWPNKQVKRSSMDSRSPESFVQAISRGDPKKWDGASASKEDFERLKKLQNTVLRNLPEGARPSFSEACGLSGLEGSQYSFVGAQHRKRASQVSRSVPKDGSSASVLEVEDDTDSFAALQEQLTELGLKFESETTDEKEAAGISPELDAVVESIHTPEELFDVLNSQLNMVQNLADEVRHKGVALQHSEEAREDLARELEATVGEKRQLGQELTALSLKFEAAQSVWEKHLEQGGSFGDFVTEEVLEKVVAALTERNKGLVDSFQAGEPDSEVFNVVDGDALAAKFRLHPEEADEQVAEDEQPIQNNAQPFERASEVSGLEGAAKM